MRGLRAGKGESDRHWTLYRNLQVPWRGATRETDRVSKTLLVFTPNYQTVTSNHLSPKRQVEAGVCAPQPYPHSRTPTPHGRTRVSLRDRLRNVEGHTPVHIHASVGP